MYFITKSLLASNQRTISKLLIANRGEIACRIARTCGSLGIKTLAVYSDAEPNARHVQLATEAVCIGSGPAATSYLCGDAIIAAAKQAGADAIHPGYGFLSEDAGFAAAVEAGGLTFVGPPASAIRAMGSKSESKEIMSRAGVPVVPGYHGAAQDDATLFAEAERIGFPLLIKAVSGGGGKGMKIVNEMSDFISQLQSARREAMNFFKNDAVILERYIERSRHIECQIFCDGHGGNVFFFERDCSIQRRYQKVLEEAPAPGLTETQRREIGAIAVRAAEAVGYVGAGTVEFIYDLARDAFYFMEMNTRLQVEHPVTEEVCRVRGKPVDFVQLQLEVAEGRPFGFSQEDISLHGSCIEARIFAENPAENFLPGSGRLEFVETPSELHTETLRVRVDSGFKGGEEVLVHFDPMIAKLIVWGDCRETALRGLTQALDNYHILGVPTNIAFLRNCCDTEDYRLKKLSTKFIPENQKVLMQPRPIPTEIQAIIALSKVSFGAGPEGAFRLNTPSEIPVFLADSPKSTEPRLYTVSQSKNSFTVSAPSFVHTITPAPALRPDHCACHVDGRIRIEYKPLVIPPSPGNPCWRVAAFTKTGAYFLYGVPLPKGFGNITYNLEGGAQVLAPMPGKIVKFLVDEGSTVKQGQAVLILEAMKMEHVVKASCSGNITFKVKEGYVASSDEQLASIEEEK